MMISERVRIPDKTSSGSKLLCYYVPNEDTHRVCAKIQMIDGCVCSGTVEFFNGNLCCRVPLWNSKDDEVSARCILEIIAEIPWRPQSAAACAAAVPSPSGENKRKFNKLDPDASKEGIIDVEFHSDPAATKKQKTIK
tara:strand:- start:170 stop:583 length:414 start_codon:yes stop_codon:yes gene_type:complete